MTVEELQGIVRRSVEDTLIDLFGDPDEGMQLREVMRRRLQRTISGRKAGGGVIPAEQVASDLGLKWE
jgi:hypothetical protein